MGALGILPDGGAAGTWAGAVPQPVDFNDAAVGAPLEAAAADYGWAVRRWLCSSWNGLWKSECWGEGGESESEDWERELHICVQLACSAVSWRAWVFW